MDEPKDHCEMDGTQLAVSIVDGPNLSERRREELALAPLMSAVIDLIVNTAESDLPMRVDAARALIEELRRTYPETMQ